jgi:hypothetical protein
VVVKNRISNSNMATSTFVVVAIMAQPPKRRSVVQLDELSLGILVSKSGDPYLSDRSLLST